MPDNRNHDAHDYAERIGEGPQQAFEEIRPEYGCAFRRSAMRAATHLGRACD